MATEAFGAHYLTDSFSSGHLRTERGSIKAHWDGKVPMFFYNLKGFMAEAIAERVSAGMRLGPLQLRSDVAYDPPFAKGTRAIITEKLDAIGPLGFGDLVSGAVHDYDNQHGVQAESEGSPARLFGDGHAGQGDEEKLAISAVRRGRAEVERAYAMGAKGGKAQEIIPSLLDDDGLFSAERLIPTAAPDERQAPSSKKPAWKFDHFEDLLADPQFAQAAALFAREKAATVAEVAQGFSADQRKAIEEGVIAPLVNKPIETVRQIIHFTPSLADSFLGHNTDDHAVSYWREAKRTKGGLRSLTYPQRERLIAHILEGATVGEDEQAILDLLTTANSQEQLRLIVRFGWQTLYDKIDDGPGEAFRTAFPKQTWCHA